MANTKISEYSSTPGNNTDIDGINIAEGCAPSGINNAIRELMSQLKDFQAGTAGDSFNGPHNGTVGATTPASGAFTTLSTTGNTTLGNDAGDVIQINGASTFTNVNPILTAGTANGVAYLNGSKVLTTGSALVFDGSNLGLGVTPSAWASSWRAFQFGIGGSLARSGAGAGDVTLASNAIFDATDNRWEYQYTGDGALRYSQAGSGVHSWHTAPSGTAGNAISFTQAMTLDASGNLGINSTATALGTYRGAEFAGTTATTGGFLRMRSSDSSINSLDFTDSNGRAIFTVTSHPLRFGTADTERARIDSSGNLLVGTTTAGAGNSRVYINGDGTNPAFRALANTSTTSVYAGIFRHESTTDGAYIQFVTNGNVETGRIFDSAGTMQYASSSDARLKTNVQPLQGGLSSVLAMNPCTYDIRRGETTTISSAGLIAQEVYEIYPHAVGVGGDDENTSPWSVDYGKLTPLLIKAIQEQQAIINQLKARLDAANL